MWDKQSKQISGKQLDSASRKYFKSISEPTFLTFFLRHNHQTNNAVSVYPGLSLVDGIVHLSCCSIEPPR